MDIAKILDLHLYLLIGIKHDIENLANTSKFQKHFGVFFAYRFQII